MLFRSANYSGAGFSDMRFKFHSMSAADFEHWVQTVKAGGESLDREGYLRLERPSEHDPVRRYATVAGGLYDSILGRPRWPLGRTISSADQASANLASANLASDNPGARAP